MGVDKVQQSKIQSLRREFEKFKKKGEMVSDFSSRFTKIISELRDLGERLEEKEVVAKLLSSMPVKYDSLTFSLEQFRNMGVLCVDEVIGSLRVHEYGFKKDNRGKKNRFYSLEPLINQRKVILDHPQEEEEEDPIQGEEEVVDMEDSPRMIKMKKRENHLISQRLSVIIVRRWVTLPINVIQIRRRKVKKKILISQKKPKKSRH